MMYIICCVDDNNSPGGPCCSERFQAQREPTEEPAAATEWYDVESISIDVKLICFFSLLLYYSFQLRVIKLSVKIEERMGMKRWNERYVSAE